MYGCKLALVPEEPVVDTLTVWLWSPAVVVVLLPAEMEISPLYQFPLAKPLVPTQDITSCVCAPVVFVEAVWV